jgi:hypothetical protein
LPEVLARFDDGSQAASKLAQLAPGLRVVPGRGPDEKVLRLAPRVPTPSGAARLLARLTAELEGRRASDRAAGVANAADGSSVAPTRPSRRFSGVERRVTQARPAARTTAAVSLVPVTSLQPLSG